jgi:hypothetical protein
MSQFLDTLEQQHGKITLWEWTRDWMQNEAECEDDERCPLVEYLSLRAENQDEVDADESNTRDDLRAPLSSR